MKTFKLFMLNLVALSLVFTGCSKEEAAPVDVRDQAVGTYDYKATFVVDGKTADDTGTLVVKKSTSASSVIEF